MEQSVVTTNERGTRIAGESKGRIRVSRDSFGGVALRVGAVTPDDLRAAFELSKRDRVGIDGVLRQRFVSPTLARGIKLVLRRAQRTCRRCGRRFDHEGISARREWLCRCRVPEKARTRSQRIPDVLIP